MRGAVGVVDTLDYGEIGKNIRQFRKKSGLQQNQLADMIGVSPQHICHIESGSALSLPVLVGISKALDVEPDVLLGILMDTSQPPSPQGEGFAVLQISGFKRYSLLHPLFQVLCRRMSFRGGLPTRNLMRPKQKILRH